MKLTRYAEADLPTVYGGALYNSWLDRDLGLSGRVAVRNGGAPEERLVRFTGPF